MRDNILGFRPRAVGNLDNFLTYSDHQEIFVYLHKIFFNPPQEYNAKEISSS
jgi:hypothetical protein